MENQTLQREPQTKALTPLMAQYWDVKSAHADKVVLFRMGDFFEMFHSDAETAAPVLGIALTARNKEASDKIPMCGVPHHSIANSINKLLSHGFKIAICDQIEDPKLAKGLVKRAVTRILSPGMVYDPDTLDGARPHYVACLDDKSVSFLDATAGEAFYFLIADPVKRARLILSLHPVEIVVSQQHRDEVSAKSLTHGMTVSLHEDLGGDEVRTLSAGGPESARRLLSYAVHMQGAKILETVLPFERRDLSDRMDLPATALLHLEIFATYKGDLKGSLFQAINRCKTSSGSRMLRERLQFPLSDIASIERRLGEVDSWRKDVSRLQSLRSTLAGLGDVQRRLGKLSSPSVNPRDLQALGESLKVGVQIAAMTPDRPWRGLQLAQDLATEIEKTIEAEPPVLLKNGGVIRRGVNPDLDFLIELSTNSSELILQLEASERAKTQIPSLKIRFNNVFGYFIEVTHTHKDKIPRDRYERKQTLANAERYMTAELSELETKVLSAQSRRIELETQIFHALVERSLKQSRELLRLANAWAEIDVDSALAWISLEQDYCRPHFTSDRGLAICGLRHPVIEQALSIPFTANDLTLQKSHALLLTGPNMAGKSTLMRSVAIAAILAQMGSFVPAKEAKLPLFERVSTRIGASDSLSEGLSTFMVEMKETAELLKTANQNSLVVLDEIGRGTSTYDGMSLAQAILENLLDERGAMVLFATHYHELTQLTERYPQLHSGHMRIHEKNGDVTFLHQLTAGPANKSYGIHVAKLAGLPSSVTVRAAGVLKKLEAGAQFDSPQLSLIEALTPAQAEAENALTQSKLAVFEVASDIKGLELSSMTPLEALNRIAKWQQSLT